MVACGRNRTGRMGKSAAIGGDSVYRSGAPRPTKMGDIASPWRYDAGAGCALRSSNLRQLAISRYALVGSGTHASCRWAAMSELGAETPNHVPQPCTGRCSPRPELTALRGSMTL